MKLIKYIIVFIAVYFLFSCNKIQYYFNQNKYKIEYQKEMNFVNSILENLSKADSIIINSSYFEQSYYNEYKYHVKSLKILEDDFNNNSLEIIGIYKSKKNKTTYNKQFNESIAIDIYRNMKPGYQTISFIFIEIHNQMKLVDIRWVIM